MGRVHQLVVENFKSYSGRVEVGPFRDFTCIIGPNGAGKSNLMDAMSFVLGVQAKVLRSGNLKELIYRKEGENPKKNERSAFVELTYVEDGGAKDGGDVAMGQTLIFRRVIQKGGEGRFQINDEAVSQADYHKKLESINILSKARNFLVFQGDVESVAARQGKDLTAFFEQISGSEAMKQEYETLAAEKNTREENARYLFTKKRNAINEKKRVAHQKDEADEYKRMEATRSQLQGEFYLFRLHGIAEQLGDAAQTTSQAAAGRATTKAKLAALQKDLDAADRERAQAHLAAQQADRALVSARSKLDRMNPERVSSRSRFNFLQQRIVELKTSNSKDVSKKEKVQAQVLILQQELSRLQVEEKDLVEGARRRDERFTPDQQREFERVRHETERITAASSGNVRQLDQQVRAVAAERAQVETDTHENKARVTFLQQRLAELKEAEEASRIAHDRDAAKAQQRAQEFNRLREANTARAEEADQLRQERQQLMDTVQDIAASERQMKHEQQLSQVCSNLAAAIPGVHGRVFDLCRPSQKRLNVAVNVALGKYLDSVVVDNSETARACVRYLKERMLSPMTFLPLADLRISAADPRVEELVGGERTARLALNCVNFDERFSRAFEFILGGVVVTDTMTDGRRLAFGEARTWGVSFKIVTLAGEAIAKNGNLSVNSEAAREGATRFDLSDSRATRVRLESVDQRLAELHRLEATASSDLAALRDEARRVDARSAEAGARLKHCQEQSLQKTAELTNAHTVLQQLSPAVEKLAAEEARLREEQRQVEGRVGQAVTGFFADLSVAMDVPDVQHFEREWRREKEVSDARMEVLTRHLRNIRAELSMLELTLMEKTPKSLEELLPKLQAEALEVHEREQVLDKEVTGLASDMSGLEAKVRDCSDVERTKEKVLSNLRQEAKELRQQMMVEEKRLNDMDSEARTLTEARADILRQSVLEDIEVPLLRGGVEALQDLAEGPGQEADAPTQEVAPGAEEAASVSIDFTSLPEDKRAASVGPAAKMLEEEYRGELERLRVEMHRLSPNLKAIEQIRGAAENVTVVSKEADIARRDIEDIEAQFEAVRKARKERFLDCFQKVASEIGNVYKKLTANTAGLHAEGGSAFLDLEDTEDPFNGGIKFTAMPPAKRFRDMHLLSGGEKTLAAMALLFAVHAYQRPPFMVLDEVDAALDANNVQALANYVEQAECQTIVISLKDRFFVKGEALVGVWKNKPQETSAVLTLDLSKYLPAQMN